jgi:hypothetical protein
MSGLVMQASMERLMLKHGLSLQTPDIVPLSPPVDYALVLEGYASTCDNIDEERVKFAPFAFGDHTTVPPLLYDHNALEPAGKIALL